MNAMLMDAINKLAGSRKLTAFGIFVAAVVAMTCTGNLDSAKAHEALIWGFGFFVGGNAVEHTTDGMARKNGNGDKTQPGETAKAS